MIDQHRHLDAAGDLRIMHEPQGGNSMAVQQLVQLRMQPAGLLVQQQAAVSGSAPNTVKYTLACA